MNEEENVTSQNLASAGREEIMQGAFGFNFRTVRSVWTLIRRPSDYFKAARTPDWMGQYTPSLVLILGITAMTVALEFFWAEPNGSFVSAINDAYQKGISDGLAAAGHTVDTSEINSRDLIAKAIGFSNVITTPIFIIILSILAWLYRAWGEKLPFVVRHRNVFAICVPVGVFGLLWLLISGFFKGTVYDVLSFVQIPFLVLITFITCRMGAFAHLDKGKAVSRSIFLTLVVFFCILITQVASILIAFNHIVFPEMEILIKDLVSTSQTL